MLISTRILQVSKCHPQQCLKVIRCISATTKTPPPFLHMAEVCNTGKTTNFSYTLQELIERLKTGNEFTLAPRDLKIFFRSNVEPLSTSSILARPDSNCFLLELEHLKLVCFADKCYVLHPNRKVVNEFVTGLRDHLKEPDENNGYNENKLAPTVQEFHKLLRNNMQVMDFEHIVLEHSLSNITSRFSRHIWLTKPALELLLAKITRQPSGPMLRRLLAFRKVLFEFESNVNQVNNVVETLLRNDEDMVGLYLTNGVRELHQHKHVERLLEAYQQDLSEILSEIRNMKNTVEETNTFIDTHLSSVRNRMIKMSVFMNMTSLSLASGAVVAGGFGMNLQHGLEEHPYAFYVTSLGTVALMGTIFGGVYLKYVNVVSDATGAHSFNALKNFFRYVNELDLIVEEKGKESFTRREFREVLNKLTGTRVTEEESDFIFSMFDLDKDGVLQKKEISLEKLGKESS